MAANVSESPGRPPGSHVKTSTSEMSEGKEKMDHTTVKDDSTLQVSAEGSKDPTLGTKRKKVSNESEDEDKSGESLDDICRKKFKPIAPKPFLKKDHHQSVVMTAMPVKEPSDISDKTAPSVESDSSPTKGAVIFMGPNMQLYPSAPFIVQPPPLVPCSGTVLQRGAGGTFSFAMPSPMGHFVPHQMTHIPGYCPSGQAYQTCCVRFPPPVIEGRDYYVNGVRPIAPLQKKDEDSKALDSSKSSSKTKSQSSSSTSTCQPVNDSKKSKASRYKYSILYNGPIYKGSTPIPQQPQISNTPQGIETTVPSTSETKNSTGNDIKLSLPAVLTSDGVLQITVPSLGSIDPKRTTNPSAFPQIKLQTIHGAVLTPGVLPTVLSPTHHPNSGHVVVVSANNQVTVPKQAPPPISRTVVCHSVAPTVNVRSDVAVSKTSSVSTTCSSAVSTVTASGSSSKDSSGVLSNVYRANTPVQSSSSKSTLLTSPPDLLPSTSQILGEEDDDAAAALDQSLGSILPRVGQACPSESSSYMRPPTTTTPISVNAASISNTEPVSSRTTLSSMSTANIASGTLTQEISNNVINEVGVVRSQTSDRTTPVDTTANADNLLTGSRTHMSNRTNTFPTNPNTTVPSASSMQENLASRSSALCRHPNLDSIDRSAGLHSSAATRDGDNNRNRSSQNASMPGNRLSDSDNRWPKNTTGHDVNSGRTPSGLIAGPRDLEDRTNLSRGSHHTTTAVSQTQSHTPHTSNPLVSANHMAPPRTISQMMTSTPSSGDRGVPSAGSTHSQAAAPSSLTNRHSISNIHVTSDTPIQRHSVSVNKAIQRPAGSSHVQNQRLHETVSNTSMTSSSNKNPQVPNLPAASSRTMSGGTIQPQHTAGLQQNTNTLRSGSSSTSSLSNTGLLAECNNSAKQHYPQTPGRMPLLHESDTSPLDSPYHFHSEMQSTQSSIMPPTNNLTKNYTNTEASMDTVPSVTPRNEFARPASSRWPQSPISTSNTSRNHTNISSSETPTADSQTVTKESYTSSSSMQQRTYPSNQLGMSSDSGHVGQLPTPPEIPIPNTGSGNLISDSGSHNITPQVSRFDSTQAPKGTSRPWQSNSTSGVSSAYSGLGLRGRSLSASQLAEPGGILAKAMSQSKNRFMPPVSIGFTGEHMDTTNVQSVPLHSNLGANTRQDMNDVIHRRTNRNSRRSSEQLSSGSSNQHRDPHLHTEQEHTCGSDTSQRFPSNVMSPEQNNSSTSGAADHSTSSLISSHGSSTLHSDSISRLPVPLVHSMLYGNSTPNLPPGMGSFGMSLPGGLGNHTMTRHPMTPPPPPPPTHHTPPRPGPHGPSPHNHMFMPSPYASMHRPLYMPAPSPRPSDLGLMSPRGYGHVHDSGLYSPRFQSMQNLQSSSSFADNILSSHLARTFSDERLDTCCSSGLHAHSPPAHNSRHMLPPPLHGFSSPSPSISHSPLSLPPSTSNPVPHRSSYHNQDRPETAMPSDIFGASHLESVVGAPVVPSSSSSQTSSAASSSSTPSRNVQSTPVSLPAPLTVCTNLNTLSNTQASASSNTTGLPSSSTTASTPSSHNSPPTSAPSPAASNASQSLTSRVYIGNTSDKYLPLEQVPTPPTSGGAPGTPSPATPSSDQVVKFGDLVLECSRQILRESGRTVLCCWHCDYHTAEPKKMYRHQKKDSKSMKCQLCDFKGYSRCTINQHFKDAHMDK